jgi:NRAMP (natural resistance-associated macrophage protein)-like metal ion transporter
MGRCKEAQGNALGGPRGTPFAVHMTSPARIRKGAKTLDPKADPTDPATASREAPAAPAGRPVSLQDEVRREPNLFKRLLKILGPGLITGASDDDPSGIGTYATAGAQLGYAPLWTALFTFPLMASVQYICAKIGLVSGRGLAGVLRQHYPRPLLYAVVLGLMAANTINAGADIVAIAAGVNLLIPIPIMALIVPLALGILALQVWGSYRLIARTFKWLTLTLFAYIASAFFARPDWGEVLQGTFLPTFRFDSTFLATLVAILGTTISPYLFFWQASQEVEEEIARGRKRLWQRKGATDGELKYAFWDVMVGMFFSNVVMYFIILATAATLHRAGRTDIRDAADAALALRPLAGDAATVLMALGLIGTGLLAVPILTGSAAYAICETFGWKCSLDARPAKAREFYLVLGISTLGGLLIDFIGINPIDALFWTAVINGFLSPPLLVVIMLIANHKRIMGRRVNGWWENVLGWTTTAVMFAAAIAFVLTWGSSP